MRTILGVVLALASVVGAEAACRQAGELCKPGVDCCAGLTCTLRPGKSAVCTVPVGPTTTTVSPPATPSTTTTLPPPGAATQAPVRPTGADVGEALLAGRGRFYVWYRGQLADQPIRDAMQQYVTGVILPELSRVLEPDCAQVIGWAYRGEGGSLDVIYRRLGNQYENLASLWSIGPQGRNYSNDVVALEKFRACLVGKAVKPALHVGLRDALALKIVGDRYVREPAFFRFCGGPAAPPCPTPDEQIGKRAPVNVRGSFPPGGDLGLLRAADSAHAAASGIGLFPLSVDVTARAYEAGPGCAAQPTLALRRSCLHFRQMKRFTGFCDPRWGADGCTRWKHVQHRFFAEWTAAQERGDWRDSRNADSDHQLAHICTNYWNPDLDVRFSIPGVDEHKWPIENCPTALARLAP